jgi:hypothetical protein
MVEATGHSLGAGVALSLSTHLAGINAYAFDASPRVFDGLGDVHEVADRIMVFQEGEALDKFRKVSTKFDDVVPSENVFVARFDFQGKNAHSSDVLAKEMLKAGAPHSADLQLVLKAMEQGVVPSRIEK